MRDFLLIILILTSWAGGIVTDATNDEMSDTTAFAVGQHRSCRWMYLTDTGGTFYWDSDLIGEHSSTSTSTLTVKKWRANTHLRRTCSNNTVALNTWTAVCVDFPNTMIVDDYHIYTGKLGDETMTECAYKLSTSGGGSGRAIAPPVTIHLPYRIIGKSTDVVWWTGDRDFTQAELDLFVSSKTRGVMNQIDTANLKHYFPFDEVNNGSAYSTAKDYVSTVVLLSSGDPIGSDHEILTHP